MADWFKFYENDLDETRLQYAISKLPEVVSVWVRTLSECCRHKSDTFRWGSNIERFGFSSRLGITVEKVDEAMKLLAEIDYIEIGEGFIKVLKWGSKQSEYCQWKQRHQNELKEVNRESVRTPSGVSSRRGEERRGDKKRVRTVQTKFSKPTIPEMELHAAKIGLPPLEINKFFNYYESKGWVVGKSPMKSWRASMVNWRENIKKFSPNGKDPSKPYVAGGNY